MINAIWRLLVYRVLGGRLLLGLTILGWIRRKLRGRRDANLGSGGPRAAGSAYQPSQGSSQIVHRDPR
jgi:hypothetical protein